MAHKVKEDNQQPTTPQATTPVVLEWDDLTPEQQQIVLWGREEPIEMPETVRSGKEIMDWLRSRRSR